MKKLILSIFLGLLVSSCGVRLAPGGENQNFDQYTLRLFGAGHDPKSVLEFKKVAKEFKGQSCTPGAKLNIIVYLEEGQIGKPAVQFDLNAFQKAIGTDCEVKADAWEWTTYLQKMQVTKKETPAAVLENSKGQVVKRFMPVADGNTIISIVNQEVGM